MNNLKYKLIDGINLQFRVNIKVFHLLVQHVV